MPAPIALFIYARPLHTAETLAALAADPLAADSDLIVFSDGAKGDADRENVAEARRIAANAQGFRSVTVRERAENGGLRRNITDGVSSLMAEHGRAIVLEDDIVVSPAFLGFMNRALDRYRDEPGVWHVSGWNYPIDPTGLGDTFLWRVMNCWGWASWADRWSHFSRDPEAIQKAWRFSQIDRFTLDAAEPDFWRQIRANARGEINTWAIFWYATIFAHGGLCLNPARSLVRNIGMDGTGTHFRKPVEADEVTLGTNAALTFPDRIAEDAEAVARIKRVMLSKGRHPASRRLRFRLKTLLGLERA